LLEGIIRRLNDVPRNNFIAFLESIGIKLLPALPARAPLTFFLSKGAKEAVTIPARSQVAAKPPAGGDPIIFETEKTILATPAKLQMIVSVVPQRDQIIEHEARLDAGQTTEMFSKIEQPLQFHGLYLAHDDFFNVKGPAKFGLSFEPPFNSDDARLVWEYCAGEKEIEVAGVKKKELDWHLLSSGEIKSGQLSLSKNQLDEIKQIKINNLNSRWIRCRVNGILSPTDPIARLSIKRISIRAGAGGSASGIDPDAAFYNDFPLAVPPSPEKPLMPFGRAPQVNPDGSISGPRPRQGDVFYLASQDAFSKKGSSITITLGSVPADARGIDVERVLEIGPKRAARLRLAGVNTVFDLLKKSPAETARIINDPGLTSAWTRNIREAAAKLILDKVVTSGGGVTAEDQKRSTPELSWEYWNGKGWLAIKDFTDGTEALTVGVPDAHSADPNPAVTGVLNFTCPEDIAPTKVLGQDNFWIRARIVSGDYGQEQVKFTTDPLVATDRTVSIDPSNIKPPKIKSLKIDYEAQGKTPQYCLTLNNLAYASFTLPLAKQGFAPFVALDDRFQSLYLGFDQAPLKGPISIFFSLQEQEYIEEKRPRVEWQYFRRLKARPKGEWVNLMVTDGTRSLTQSGAVEFIGPDDFAIEFLDAPDSAQVPRFGKPLFWIRAIDDANRFTAKTPPPAPEEGTKKPGPKKNPEEMLAADIKSINPPALIELPGFSIADIRRITPPPPRGLQDFTGRMQQGVGDVASAPTPKGPTLCERGIESLTSFVTFPTSPSTTPSSPIVQGVYLNTAWGIQAETIQDEILGSSNGSANQEFKLTKLPVIAESIWVNELATLTEAQRTTLAQQTDFEVKIRKDAEDQVIEFLVRWQAIDDLAQAGPADRVYAIDRTFGLVTFGDGASHGQVPPIGKDNLKATYQSGGGARGNVPRGAIKSLRSTIPLVESAVNPEAAGGGSDTEPIEKALERGPKVIKNRGRAIAAEDFEALAREASQAIGRARCLPTFDDGGKYRTGWVTVVIVPDSNEARPSPSPQLRQRVEKYLRDRSANVAAFPRHIKVIPPAYVGINVLADVYPLTMDLAPQVESAAIAALQKFLHPLTGGYRNSGWDFGSFPCLSDFYRLLEEVEGVDHVDNLSLSLQATTLLGEPNGAPLVVSEDRPIDVTAPSFALVYSGEHKITVKSA
jgi:uncharacterized phage protein gp47/JayE